MSVVSSIENLGPCLKRVEIEVPAPAVDAETMRVVRDYGRNVRIPGFRKGKVPANLVQQRFRGEIEKEVLDRLVPRYWKQAEAEASLEPLLPPSVGDVELQKGEPLTFTATVEVRPELELGDLDHFELPNTETEPTADEVDEALGNLQSQVGEWVETDRAAVRGDLVSMESQELDDEGEALQETQSLDVEVGSPRVWEELSLALTGLEAGQESEFRRQEEVDGETRVRHFRVKAGVVKEKDLPPLDDEFAAKLGEFENLEALRDQVEERLRVEKRDHAQNEKEQAVLEQLRDRHPLELPRGVVEEETRHLLQEYAESLGHQGVELEKAKIDWEGLAQEVRPQAERRVHVRLLLDAVADNDDIQVEPEEFEARLAELAKAQGQTTSAIRAALGKSGQLESMGRQMRRRKTIDRLLAAGAAAEGD